MNKIAEVFVGVDVAKEKLDVYLHPVGKSFVIKNNTRGIKKLLKILLPYQVKELACEASGGYERPLVRAKNIEEYKLRIINPRRIRNFANAKGINAKTDKIDAKIIALFCSAIPSEHGQTKINSKQMELRELVKYKNNLKDMLTQEKTRLKSPVCKSPLTFVRQHINFLEKKLLKLKNKIKELIKTDKEMQRRQTLMETMIGVGQETSTALVADMPELGTLNEKEVAALLGVAPFTRQSGSWKGAATIRDGRFAARKAVYMAALTAAQHNPVFEVFYNKLVNRGKQAKVAHCCGNEKNNYHS